MQYINFLAAAVPSREYAGALPELARMALDFRIPPEVLYHMYRPLLVSARAAQVATAEDGEIGGAAGVHHLAYACFLLEDMLHAL